MTTAHLSDSASSVQAWVRTGCHVATEHQTRPAGSGQVGTTHPVYTQLFRQRAIEAPTGSRSLDVSASAAPRPLIPFFGRVDPMSASSHLLTARALDLLDHNDEEGFRTSHLEQFDFSAFEEGRYGELVQDLEDRLSRERYSVISMLLAGIYFGLLMGHWLLDTSSWLLIARWAIPVGLVAVYAVVTARNILNRIERLSQAQALVHALDDHDSARPPVDAESDDTVPA